MYEDRIAKGTGPLWNRGTRKVSVSIETQPPPPPQGTSISTLGTWTRECGCKVIHVVLTKEGGSGM